jgi:ParB-like chromosome segregation protein Spo0J
MGKHKTVKISEVKLNPNNPRLIKDDKFKKLVQSIKEFPEMLDIRPIVVNQDMIILGGNMRFKACKEAGLKEIPVIVADNLTEEQQREFLIKDNTSGGEWDFEMLAKEWNIEQLEEWGLDVPNFDLEPSYEDLIGEKKNKPATLKITFESPEQLQKAEIDIQELIDRKYNGAYFSVSAGEL